MGIFLLILFIILLAIDFRRTFVIFMVFSIWIRHFDFTLPYNLAFYPTLSFVAFILFFILENKNDFKSNIIYPLLFPSFLIALSFILSEIYANDEHHYPTVFFSLFPYLGNVFIFWALFQNNPRTVIKLFWKSSIILASVVAVYALIETLTSSNFFVDWMIKLKVYTYENIITDVRFGIHRSQSVFSMHTTNGIACTLLAITLLWLKRKYNFVEGKNFFINVLCFLLIVTVFMTGSRATIIGMMVCLAVFLNLKRIRVGNFILGVFFICCIAVLADDYLVKVLDSIVNTDNVAGSTSSMRSTQFETSYYYMSRSFFFGNGNGYVWRYVQEYYKLDILGAESMWFPEMIDRGFLGCLTLFIYIYSCTYYVWKHCDKSLLFFVAGITIMNTLSSLPKFYFTYLFIYILVFSNIKLSRHENKTKTIQRLAIV